MSGNPFGFTPGGGSGGEDPDPMAALLGMLGLVPKLVSGAATEIVRPGTHATD